MAATLTQDRFTGPDWIFERKFDGIRLLAFWNDSKIQLFSRNQLPQDLPSIAAGIARLPVQEVILDGEVTWNSGGVVFHVFDVLWVDGRDLMALPLLERRIILENLPFEPPLQLVEVLTTPNPWELARCERWEGVIAKRRDSCYEHRRSPHWLKMKCEASQELVIGGFTDPQGARTGLGALLVGYFENGGFVYAGKVGTGFDAKLLVELRSQLDAIEILKSPFTKSTGLPRLRAHWTRPEIVVQVAFIQWTKHGKLRHSRFLGVRTDKAARDVVRESP